MVYRTPVATIPLSSSKQICSGPPAAARPCEPDRYLFTVATLIETSLDLEQTENGQGMTSEAVWLGA